MDRWLKITNQAGISCYAQWEDFGPGSDDDAEYVFGDKPPKFEQGAGIDLSPSTAKFLNIDDKTRIVSWQFVDEKNVPPGPWLSDQPEPDKPETQPQVPVKAGTGSIMAPTSCSEDISQAADTRSNLYVFAQIDLVDNGKQAEMFKLEPSREQS